MSKKEKYKKSARNLLISGVLGLVMTLIFKIVLDNTRGYSFYSGDYSTWKFLKVLLVICVVASVFELILSFVYAIMAANEPEDIADPYKYGNEYQGNRLHQNMYYNTNGYNHSMNISMNNSLSETLPTEGFWKCTKCGRVNADYVGTCGCGECRTVLKQKVDNPDEVRNNNLTPNKELKSNYKMEDVQSESLAKVKRYCPYCGEPTETKYMYCRMCGANLKA